MSNEDNQPYYEAQIGVCMKTFAPVIKWRQRADTLLEAQQALARAQGQDGYLRGMDWCIMHYIPTRYGFDGRVLEESKEVEPWESY